MLDGRSTITHSDADVFSSYFVKLNVDVFRSLINDWIPGRSVGGKNKLVINC